MPANRAEVASHPALRAIAVFKFCKALGLVLVAIVAFGLVRNAAAEHLAATIERLPIEHGRRYLIDALQTLVSMGPSRFALIGVAALVYASVFVVEGVGLWRGKRWAEYLTTIVTASLIPFEIYENLHKFTWIKLGALVVNVLIVAYLWYVIRSRGPRPA